MNDARASGPVPRPVRVFCIEDNALLVIHLQAIIEGAGHVFAGFAVRFDEVKAAFAETDFDLALVDIDLADGRTGASIAQWLQARGRPSLFLTGQDQLTRDYADVSLGTIGKPVSEEKLCEALREFGTRQDGPGSPEL
jgi:DNA-binding response OmpR family regulator